MGPFGRPIFGTVFRFVSVARHMRSLSRSPVRLGLFPTPTNMQDTMHWSQQRSSFSLAFIDFFHPERSICFNVNFQLESSKQAKFVEHVSRCAFQPFASHCRYEWSCHCINLVNLHNAIVFSNTNLGKYERHAISYDEVECCLEFENPLLSLSASKRNRPQ